MTLFDLRSVRLRSGEEYRDEEQIDFAPLVLGGLTYAAVPERVTAELSVVRVSSGTVFELRFKTRLHGPCCRCLADAVIERELSLREYQATNPEGSEELTSPYVAEGRLDLSAWARDSLALSLPDKILCRDECAGLCPTCGADLNVDPHVHGEEVVDPRWAALAELRDRL